MLNIYLPQTLLGDSEVERLVAADLVRVGDEVRLFLPQYADFATSDADIELGCAGTRLRGTPVGTPASALKFAVPATHADDRFSVYRDGHFCGRLKAQSWRPARSVPLTAATLFKDDHAQVRTWMDYHATLGFERFVLYYNGPLAAILPELLAQPAILEKDVLLVQWPFTYWVEGTRLGPEGLVAKYGDRADLTRVASPDRHHAQQLMLDHALTLLDGTTEFLGFLDLDEYLRLDRPFRLIDFLRANQKDVYVFPSRWAELVSGRVPGLGDDERFFDAEDVQASPWIPVPSRSKYIARPGCVLGTGAHIPNATTPGTQMVRVEPTVAGLFHFHCFSGKAPRRGFVNPSGEWVGVADFRPPALQPVALAA